MKTTVVVIAEADVPNKNGRVYPRDTLERMIREQNKKDPIRVFGMIGMPAEISIDLARVSHSISNLRLDEQNRLVGDMVVLATPQGEIMQKILEAEPSRQFRMAGIGKLEDNDDGTTTVTDFRLLSINLVRDGA